MNNADYMYVCIINRVHGHVHLALRDTYYHDVDRGSSVDTGLITAFLGITCRPCITTPPTRMLHVLTVGNLDEIRSHEGYSRSPARKVQLV